MIALVDVYVSLQYIAAPVMLNMQVKAFADMYVIELMNSTITHVPGSGGVFESPYLASVTSTCTIASFSAT